MDNQNINLLIDISVLLGLLILGSRLLYVRLNRVAYISKRGYKKDSLEYKNIYRNTSNRVLTGGAAIFLFMLVKTVMDVIHAMRASGSQEILFIFGFVIFIGVAVFVSVATSIHTDDGSK